MSVCINTIIYFPYLFKKKCNYFFIFFILFIYSCVPVQAFILPKKKIPIVHSGLVAHSPCDS